MGVQNKVKHSSYDFICIYCNKKIGSKTMRWKSEIVNGVVRGLGFYHDSCGSVMQSADISHVNLP